MDWKLTGLRRRSILLIGVRRVTTVIHWLLIVSLALGAPMASCCQWGALARSAVASFAGPSGHDGCCCAAAPVEDDGSGCDRTTRCTCGPAKRLFAETGADRIGGPALASCVPAAASAAAEPPDVFAASVLALARPPPVLTLLRLHCALTI
jgi:hypothetical protein